MPLSQEGLRLFSALTALDSSSVGITMGGESEPSTGGIIPLSQDGLYLLVGMLGAAGAITSSKGIGGSLPKYVFMGGWTRV